MERRYGLSSFPSFSNEAELIRALRDQGFSAERRGPGWIIRNSQGEQRTIHSGSVTNRYGNVQRNAMRILAGLGFIPPAEFERQRRDQRAVERREAAAMAGTVVTDIPAAPATPQEPAIKQTAVDLRAYPCEHCAQQRCKLCQDRDEPCAFPFANNLGRHLTSIHGEVGKVAAARQEPKQPEEKGTKATRKRTTRRKAAPVRVRTDVGVVEDRLKAAMLVLANEVDSLQQELKELRAYKARTEQLVGRLYDEATKPSKK